MQFLKANKRVKYRIVDKSNMTTNFRDIHKYDRPGYIYYI